jgi:hypothetical protein
MLPGFPSQSAMPTVPVFDHLTPEQAAGRACVVGLCRATYRAEDPAAVVVGVSKATGMKVRACRSGCAQLVGWVPRSGWVQRAL